MHRANIKQHRSLFPNQNFKEGSLALIFGKQKLFFFFFLQGDGRLIFCCLLSLMYPMW